MILQHKGINISYTDHGQGTPVVLLHGFLENSTMWQPFMPELSKKNRIICIDLLGHGKTECLGYVHSMELMAEAVKAVLDFLNIKNSIFIGHSMGGYVALAFSEKFQKQVLGLCLMNSTAEDDTPERKKNRDRAILTVKENHKSFIRIAIVNLFRPKNRRLFSKEIKHIKEEALKMPVQGIVAALEGMKVRKNRIELFRDGNFKKQMIISKKDPVLDYEALKKQSEKSTIEIVEFPDGHMSHVENKSLFLRTMLYFVEKI
ncbi:alpha/beta hydrolase [Yeosuana marina]|uniref:alpha/beta fold hydrolase n=1 Tax=Yeosuana marina TaxID=1565536 RepID=UPI0030C7E45D